MRAQIRRQLSMAARVIDFAEAHPSTDASYNALVTRMKGRLARADQLAMQQQNGASGERAAKAHRANLKKTLERVQLRHLVGVAAMAAQDHPELKEMFKAPRSGAALKVVITAAKSLMDAAVPHKDVFASVGMGDTFLDELTAAVNEFDQSTDAVHSGQRQHVGATGELRVAAEDCVKMAKLMDGLFRIRFKNDPESLTAWESARNIVGPFRRSKKEDEPPVVTALLPAPPSTPAAGPA